MNRGGGLAWPIYSDSSLCPCTSNVKMFLSSGYKKGCSQVGVLWPTSEEKGGSGHRVTFLGIDWYQLQGKRSGEGKNGLLESTVFSNAKVPYFGVVGPKPHHHESRKRRKLHVQNYSRLKVWELYEKPSNPAWLDERLTWKKWQPVKLRRMVLFKW